MPFGNREFVIRSWFKTITLLERSLQQGGLSQLQSGTPATATRASTPWPTAKGLLT
ncbi:MAG: hypothetical protein WBG32_19995 [Nodosilinea sp.]